MALDSLTEVSDLEVWYDLSDSETVTLDGSDNVSQVDDKSGNDRHISQATASKRPAFDADALFGHGGMEFDGSDDIMASSSFGPLSQPNTVFIVGGLLTIPSSDNRPIMDGISSSDRHWIGNSSGEFAYWSGSEFREGELEYAGLFLWTVQVNGASSLFREGGRQTGSGDSGSHGLGGVTLGARHDDNLHANWLIGQVAVYGRALSSSEIEDVEEYLANQTRLVRYMTEFGSLSSSGAKWAYGALADNGKIYGAPFRSQTVLKIDPSDDSVSTFGTDVGSGGDNSWVGLVKAGSGILYGIPEDEGTVLKIDPSDDSWSTFGAVAGTYYGGVLADNGKIYGAPFESDDILEIDPSDDSVSEFNDGGSVPTGAPGNGKWGFFVKDGDGDLYAIPREDDEVLKLDPSSLSVSTFDDSEDLSASRKWSGGVYASDGKIYGVPRNDSRILVIDPSDDSISFIAHSPSSDNRYTDVIEEDGLLYFFPRANTSLFGILEISSGDWWLQRAKPVGEDLHVGFVRTGDSVYGIPFQATSVIKYALPEDLGAGGTPVENSATVATATSDGLDATTDAQVAITNTAEIGTATAQGLNAIATGKVAVTHQATVGTATATGLDATTAADVAGLFSGEVGTAQSQGLNAIATGKTAITHSAEVGTATAQGLGATVSSAGAGVFEATTGTAQAEGLDAIVDAQVEITHQATTGTATSQGLDAETVSGTSVTLEATTGTANAIGLDGSLNVEIVFEAEPGTAVSQGLDAVVNAGSEITWTAETGTAIAEGLAGETSTGGITLDATTGEAIASGLDATLAEVVVITDIKATRSFRDGDREYKDLARRQY